MLKNFLNSIIKKDGFILETSDKKNYIIGKPIKKNPVKFKLKNKSIEYKTPLFPDFYFGKGYRTKNDMKCYLAIDICKILVKTKV